MWMTKMLQELLAQLPIPKVSNRCSTVVHFRRLMDSNGSSAAARGRVQAASVVRCQHSANQSQVAQSALEQWARIHEIEREAKTKAPRRGPC
ncbi:MAG: hypothetical protein QUV35_12540 [Hydrogenophaga sp.]|uniref:hypothetical protein n=1 Tax=Hydrogenophaga sp. TaxID=1904254 RepID=UPI0026232064|nr:hypothetical protein [Hydrogenophaga sp.]MDM7943446.1 hypothetical protein [Hydrogenophaga sp.]